MTKEEVLQDFLNSLKIALNNSSIYFETHPVLIKSIDELEEKIDSLFHFINPIKVGFTPRSLFVDGKVLEKTRLYEELAVFFHFRKIKSIEIRDETTRRDLVRFLVKVSLPAKVLFKEGGIEDILKKEQISAICIEDLDYSQLLNAQGKEYKEIWAYLFRDIIEKKDREKIDQFINNFDTIVSKFKSEELFENEDLKENILAFLAYLKNNKEDEFRKCIKEIVKVMMKEKNTFTESQLLKARAFFQGVTSDEFADILWQEVAEDENFDTVALRVFSCLMSSNKQHDEIALSLKEKMRREESSMSQPLTSKLKELFSSLGKEPVSGVYMKSLSSLLDGKQSKETEVKAFDRGTLCANYRLMVLNLLVEETNKARLVLISKKLSEEWYNLIKDKDAGFFRKFLEIFEKKKKDLAFYEIFEPFEKQMCSFIENSIVEENIPEGFECFVDMLPQSTLTVSVYLEKIFNDLKVDPCILRLFFKFFPANLPMFYNGLKKTSSNMEFLRNMIISIKYINSRLGVEILKYIFSFSGKLVKIEALKAMREMSKRDEEFLLSLLRGGEGFLKREALLALCSDDKARKDALEILLCVTSPFGMHNEILGENVEIVQETDALPFAREYLVVLSRRRFFWNRALRRKAEDALEKIHG